MPPPGEVVASVTSALAVLLACVELGDAAAAVGVYRLIQYDLAGAPFGSRAAALNHHAATFPLPAGADLSRSALVAPLLDLPLSFLRGTVSSPSCIYSDKIDLFNPVQLAHYIAFSWIGFIS
jgi:hypothetical protein